VSPGKGLGNRIISLVSHFRIAILNGLAFKLDWPESEEFISPVSTFIDVNYPVNHTTYSKLGNISLSRNSVGRVFIRDGDLRSEANVVAGWHHFLWRETDLTDLDFAKMQNLTRELRSIARHVFPPSQMIINYLSNFPESFDLGVHIRRTNLYDTFLYTDKAEAYSAKSLGIDNFKESPQWNELDDVKVIIQCLRALEAVKPKSVFICSSDKVLVSNLRHILLKRDIKVYVNDTDQLSFDEATIVDYFCLCRCLAIFRDARSSFAAAASLQGIAASQFTFDQYNRLVGPRPILVLSGAAF